VAERLFDTNGGPGWYAVRVYELAGDRHWRDTVMSVCSQFVVEENCGRKGWEVRKPSLLDDLQAQQLKRQLPVLTIDKPEALTLLGRVPCWAVVRSDLAGTLLRPHAHRFVARWALGGFIAVDPERRWATERRPTPVTRQRVLERDFGRCRLCGRSPAENPDIELELHHVVPWATGGLTHEQNLVTLCHRCHRKMRGRDERPLRTVMEHLLGPTEPDSLGIMRLRGDVLEEHAMAWWQSNAMIIGLVSRSTLLRAVAWPEVGRRTRQAA
jgi:HNH endonuclease